MKNTNYSVIGVMSGTSLDGIDLTLVNFYKSENRWNYRIEFAETVAYTEDWKDKLEKASSINKLELQALDEAYTNYLAEKIRFFIDKNNIGKAIICSHGHTVLHQPERQITYQIGNLPSLAKKTGKKVVCDFRVQDVALGGQGAPLVPVGDELLFKEFDYCLNLGGFANISFKKNDERIAFDICPVNTVLNFYAQKFGKEYDVDGDIARKNKLDENLLQELNALLFYHLEPPKSLGIEWVQTEVFPLLEKSRLSSAIIIATFTEHVAKQIANVCENSSTKKMLITGGGAFNKYLISRIQNYSSVQMVVPESLLIEYKEALLFGFLGVLKIRGEINVLKSVTGAKQDHSSGKIYLP
ncbi:anhydro-N-acetylmuramic acid kinase [Mesonia aquimarina]|uniref:anhydro-N-acetylmuramic acid kinase n=1 Tax=Mesonia aquimarina TaxID=1504967 RepID=UPI000EF5FEFE|nr:anhydro-N-acetylmuramic acid kinase [Mesonia aquimarina]